ncbi:MAG: phage/plasmid primase, P4 family [Pyrobaculum sp.]
MDVGYTPSPIDNGISIKSIELTPIKLTKSEGWFKAGDKLVVLLRKKNNTLIAIVGEKTENVYTIGPEGLNCMRHSIPLNGVDICEQIDEILRNYDALALQFELEAKAKASKALNYSAVPRMPTDFETVVHAIAKLMLSRMVIKTFYIPSKEKNAILGIYCYNNGYYSECEDLLKRDVYDVIQSVAGGEVQLLDMRLVPSVKGAVIKTIMDKTLTEYKPTQRCLLFQNRVFCWDAFIKTGDIEAALIDPSPDLIIVHRIPWRLNIELLKRRPGILKYIPPENIEQLITLFKELAPKSYTAFLNWVRKPEESEQAAYPRVALLLELIGYVLYPHDYPLHKAALLVGEGSNGKSTYLRLIETIVGRENVASVNLIELDPNVNRFAASNLVHKLVNISSEPYRSKSAFDATRFKELTGEDVILVDRKNRDPINYRNYAKLIFAANELPSVSEDTYAFWRRWIVIEFPNRFSPDPEFFERTFTQEEIEAIILLSIYAFRLVLKRKAFSESGVEDVKSVWLSRSNPIYAVVRRMIEDGVIELRQDGYIIKTDLYALYKAYAEIMTEEGDADVKVLAQKDFTIHLTRFFPVRSGTARIGGKQRYVYWGVAIKDYERVKQLIGQVETPRPL